MTALNALLTTSIQENLSARSRPEQFSLLASLTCVLLVLPFAIHRALISDWFIASIDGLIISSQIICLLYTYRTHNANPALQSNAILLVMGSIASLYTLGPSQTIWMYPAFAASFYLLQPKRAILLTCIGYVLALPILIPNTDIRLFFSLTFTLAANAAFSLIFAEVTRRQNTKLTLMAMQDALTNTGNRRALDLRLNEMVIKKNPKPARVYLFDLDNFKDINDKLGHAVGDNLLVAFVELLTALVKKPENLFRYGGDEFVYIDLEATEDIQQERLCIFHHTFNDQHASETISISASVGSALYSGDEAAEQWLNKADKSLLLAKRLRRKQR